MFQEIQVVEKRRYYIPKRYILTALGFFGFFNIYTMKVNLSVAMDSMVNDTENSESNYSHKEVECAMLMHPKEKTLQKQYRGEQYNWDSQTQGMILGAVFYGYIVTQIPGGLFAEKFGAKWLFGSGIFVTSLLTILTSVVASYGTIFFMIVRVLEGFFEGVTFPAMTYIISQWAPPLERSRISTIIFMGAQMGNVISLPISGLLCNSVLLGGWPSVFYISGTVGSIWFMFWGCLAHESPKTHPTISKEELACFQIDEDNSLLKKRKTPWKSIFTSIPMWATLVAHFGHNLGFLLYLTELPSYLSSILHLNIEEKRKTPWKSIFTSIPMWATLVAHFGHNLGFLLYLTELPSYLSSILHLNIEEVGVLCALPYTVQALMACIASYIADRLRSSGTLTVTNIRKLMNTIGLVGPAVCLLCITISGCRPQLIVFLLTLAMALNGFSYSGFNVTHVDMCPDIAGTLYGLTNGCANLCGIIAPALVGSFTSTGVTILNWNKVFYITSATYFAGAIFYLLFASAELQPWGKNKTTEEQIS